MVEQEPVDFVKIGLKSGIEIHQQLDTHKLFCNCPSLLRRDEPDFEVNRRLHVVAGESGEVDIAAKHEAEQKKQFVYQGYNNTTCLVELDEQPPLEINQEALEITLKIALLLNCEILSVSQVMRKTVIDGSNTSGFQRTVLIARNGYVETQHGRVGIDNLNLEEDAARIISREPDKNVFRLDRLGIPLVEIGTSPDIKSPEQAKEVALYIGEVLRACKVKRGLGTIRQDVNLSIKGGQRVEIKGVQDPRLIGKTIESEIVRQLDLIKKQESIAEVRKANPDGSTSFLRPLPGAARMYPETDVPFLKISKQMIDDARKNLPKLRQDVREDLIERGLSEEMINLILGEGLLEEFEAMILVYGKVNFVAKVLALWPKELAKKIKNAGEKITIDVIESLLERVSKGRIKEGEVYEVMERIAKGESFEQAVQVKRVDLREIEQEVLKLLKEKPGLSIGAYMGLVMERYKGKVSGKDVSDILKKLIN